jgi:hypothetical protein
MPARVVTDLPSGLQIFLYVIMSFIESNTERAGASSLPRRNQIWARKRLIRCCQVASKALL